MGHVQLVVTGGEDDIVDLGQPVLKIIIELYTLAVHLVEFNSGQAAGVINGLPLEM